MKALASPWLGLVVVAIGGAACSDDASAGSDCEDRLVARLPADLTGPFVFEGTADGVPFRCAYEVHRPGPEATRVDAATCDAPVVSLELEHWASSASGVYGDRVRAVFPGPPEAVIWTWSGVDPEVTRTGTFSSDDRCREVEVEYP